MTPQQVLLVKHSFRSASPQHERLARVFQAELFARDPALWQLFRSDAALRPARLRDALAAIVESIDRLHPIVPVLEWLAFQAARRRVGRPQLVAIGEALIAALEDELGDDFGADHFDAWAAAYRRVTEVMLKALAEEPLAA
jgi:hemoglobin-like flavoprotein